MNDLQQRINSTLDLILSDSPMCDMATYALEGGKRLRPLLMLSLTESQGVPLEHALIPAAALECVHTYSLIHDDLPCMDDDDERRGRPSFHRAFSESDAILTGDFLLTFAFEALSFAPHLTPEKRLAMIQTLALRSGDNGMIGGQLIDLEDESTTEQEITFLNEMKTGALFCASLECGAILSDLPLPPLVELGKKLGVAYQLIDDLADNDGSVFHLGKRGVEELVETFTVDIDLLLPDAPLLQELIDTILCRKKVKAG